MKETLEQEMFNMLSKVYMKQLYRLNLFDCVDSRCQCCPSEERGKVNLGCLFRCPFLALLKYECAVS